VIVHEGSVVWDGALERLRDEAPAAAYRLWTSDDTRAYALGREHGIDIARTPSRELTVRADDEVRSNNWQGKPFINPVYAFDGCFGTP
jgi:hypothetical protein